MDSYDRLVARDAGLHTYSLLHPDATHRARVLRRRNKVLKQMIRALRHRCEFLKSLLHSQVGPTEPIME